MNSNQDGRSMPASTPESLAPEVARQTWPAWIEAITYRIDAHRSKRASMLPMLNGSDLKLLLAIATMTSRLTCDPGPGNAKLAELTGLSIRQIKRTLTSLKARHLLHIVPAKGRTPAVIKMVTSASAQNSPTVDTDVLGQNTRWGHFGRDTGDIAGALIKDEPDPETRSLSTESLEDVFLTFPCVPGAARKSRFFTLTQKQASDWRSTYTVDVAFECRRALAWLIANPSKRKGHDGMLHFLGQWLGRAQKSQPYRPTSLYPSTIIRKGKIR